MPTTYNVELIVFSIILGAALVFDLGVLSKKNSAITAKQALYQTLFWVFLSLLFCGFLWYEVDALTATKYFTAYLMEWSLSIDNVFVFILLFNFFVVPKADAGRALLIGILLAIVFRIVFISVGIELLHRFYWLMYVFGGFLIYTGMRLFFKSETSEYNPSRSKVYRYLSSFFSVSHEPAKGRFWIKKGKRRQITTLFVSVVMLAFTDIVFALDSIPTVVSIVLGGAHQSIQPTDTLIIYFSNILAVLGLRSLYFLLRNAVDSFQYLQQGIAVVLLFVGAKMLADFFHLHVSIFVSLLVIVVCIGGSVGLSAIVHKKKAASKTAA